MLENPDWTEEEAIADAVDKIGVDKTKLEEGKFDNVSDFKIHLEDQIKHEKNNLDTLSKKAGELLRNGGKELEEDKEFLAIKEKLEEISKHVNRLEKYYKKEEHKNEEETSVSFLSDEERKKYIQSFRDEYSQLKEDYEKKKSDKSFISLEEARRNRLKIDWTTSRIVKPNKPGLTVLNNYSLSKLREYIDWTPFFMTWELKGKYKAPGVKRPRFATMRYTAVYDKPSGWEVPVKAVQRQSAQFENLFKELGTVDNGFPEDIDLNTLANRAEYDPEMLRTNLMFGTPDEVIGRLKDYEKLGVDNFIYCASYGLPMKEQRASLKLFCNEVVPEFQRHERARSAAE